MKRVEVPRLPLHNLQGGIISTQDEGSNHAEPALVLHDQPILGASENQEPSPPPSRILRSGKRVPLGSVTRAAPRPVSKANKPSTSTADEVQAAQPGGPASLGNQHTAVPLQPVNIPAVPQQAPARHTSQRSQGIASLHTMTPDGVKPALASVARSHSAAGGPPITQSSSAHCPMPVAAQAGPLLSSTPLLMDLQTSVSASATSPVQLYAQPTTTAAVAPTADASSPIALAPAAATAEAPTPTLLPKAVGIEASPVDSQKGIAPPLDYSVGHATAAHASAAAAAADTSALGSPRDILSSLQQMNLQSRPFDFTSDTESSVSAAVEHEQTPSPYHVSPGPANQDPTPVQRPQQAMRVPIQQSPVESGHSTSAVPRHAQRVAVGDSKQAENVEHAAVETAESLPVGYVSRRTTDPYMEKKLRSLQKEEWSSADKRLKVHKSKLELEKERAAAARSSELSDADKASVRRMVSGAFQRVVATGGQTLGETMLKHKSRLECEKEVAQQQRQAEEAAQAHKAKRKVTHTPGSWTKQGLGELGKHKSRLEKEKEAAAAARKAAGGSPAPGKLPSYMRPTSASKAMQKGLEEDLVKPKSRLEREKEVAAASTSEVRRSASSLGVRSKVAEAWQGQGLESVMHKRKSKLEQDKENAAADAAAAAATKPSPKGSQKSSSARKSSGWGGQGLGDMKVHKSKLQKDQDAWAKAAAAEEGKSEAGTTASRKALLEEARNNGQNAGPSVSKKVPSYMKSTHTSATRNSTGAAPDPDARYAF